MSGLDFGRVIDRLVLPGAGLVEAKGLILLVGANSTGKSQLLQDLFQRATGAPRPLVVAKEVLVGKPRDPQALLNALVKEGFLERRELQPNVDGYRPLTTHAGLGQGIPQVPIENFIRMHAKFDPNRTDADRVASDFLGFYGKLVVSALFLDRRLTSLAGVGAFDYEAGPPQTDLQSLHLDEKAKARLADEVARVFHKHIWLDASRGGSLVLRVCDLADTPSDRQKLEPRTAGKFKSIEQEGDGLKSYVAICLALLLGRRLLNIIDEPEMCLHPPQAHALGAFVAEFGADTATCSVVATHSSHFLRGVLQTSTTAQVIRLSRSRSAFNCHIVSVAELAKLVSRPGLRSEAVLDGVFSECVVVVESDADRHVYQAVWDSLHAETGLDVHLAAVGGVGGIHHAARYYASLRIPFAIVADLDFLANEDAISATIQVLAAPDVASSLLESVRIVVAGLRAIPPTLEPEDASAELRRIAATSRDWTQQDDRALSVELRSLANRVDRLRRLSGGRYATLPQELQGTIHRLLGELAVLGLHLVPSGELEDWFTGSEVTTSRDRKSEWATEAAQFVRKSADLTHGVWAFARGIQRGMATRPAQVKA